MGSASSRTTTAAVAPITADEDQKHRSPVERFCDRLPAVLEGTSGMEVAVHGCFSTKHAGEIRVCEAGKVVPTAPYRGRAFVGPKGPFAYRSAVSEHLSFQDCSFDEPVVDEEDPRRVLVRGRAVCTSKSTGDSFDERLRFQFLLDDDGKILVWKVGTLSGCYGPGYTPPSRPSGSGTWYVTPRFGTQFVAYTPEEWERYRRRVLRCDRILRWICLRRSRDVPIKSVG